MLPPRPGSAWWSPAAASPRCVRPSRAVEQARASSCLGAQRESGGTRTESTRATGAVRAAATPRMNSCPDGWRAAPPGGYEDNLDWLAEHWVEGARNYRVRGSRWNDGALLRHLLDAGAEARGNPRGFHAIAVDARSPQFDGGIVTRVDSVPFGIA